MQQEFWQIGTEEQAQRQTQARLRQIPHMRLPLIDILSTKIDSFPFQQDSLLLTRGNKLGNVEKLEKNAGVGGSPVTDFGRTELCIESSHFQSFLPSIAANCSA